MNILNNIWVAISTPNEVLTNIMVSMSTFVENFLIMLLFLTILDIKSSKKQKLTYVISMSIVSILAVYILPSPFNILSNYFMMIIAHCAHIVNIL